MRIIDGWKIEMKKSWSSCQEFSSNNEEKKTIMSNNYQFVVFSEKGNGFFIIYFPTIWRFILVNNWLINNNIVFFFLWGQNRIECIKEEQLLSDNSEIEDDDKSSIRKRLINSPMVSNNRRNNHNSKRQIRIESTRTLRRRETIENSSKFHQQRQQYEQNMTLVKKTNEFNGNKSSSKAKIPRPANAFMLFANKWRKKLAAENPKESNKDISVRLVILIFSYF